MERQEDSILLARIDERTKATKESVDHLHDCLHKNYVRKEEFGPVKKISFTLVALVCAAVVAKIMGKL